MEETEKTECIDWGGHVCGEITANNETWDDKLVKNAHDGLPQPFSDCDRCSVISGDCLYYHYGCDGKDDRGWGCGYRTIQTMSSWLCFNQPQSVSHKRRHPPSLPEIQQTLVEIGDKPHSFLGSREWIGTFEASLVLDQLYDVPCRIVHVRNGKELYQTIEDLHNHFLTRGSPVMMGGDRDNSSKGILGVCTGKQESYLLVMDPHYFGCPLDKNSLQRKGWVSWKPVASMDQCSFYNLCLPLSAKK